VVLTRWRQGSSGSLWALLGFGLTLLLCVAIPAVQTVVQSWVVEMEPSRRGTLYSALSMLWSVLRAATYALLLVAVYAGRNSAGGARTASLSRP
jgi:hypothetical protein